MVMAVATVQLSLTFRNIPGEMSNFVFYTDIQTGQLKVENHKFANATEIHK